MRFVRLVFLHISFNSAEYVFRRARLSAHSRASTLPARTALRSGYDATRKKGIANRRIIPAVLGPTSSCMWYTQEKWSPSSQFCRRKALWCTVKVEWRRSVEQMRAHTQQQRTKLNKSILHESELNGCLIYIIYRWHRRQKQEQATKQTRGNENINCSSKIYVYIMMCIANAEITQTRVVTRRLQSIFVLFIDVSLIGMYDSISPLSVRSN